MSRGGPKGIDWSAVSDLGRVPDTVVAARLGVGRLSVLRARKQLGIPAFAKPEVYDFSNAALGVASDGAIARELGCHPTAVHYARKRRGIVAAGGAR